MPRPYCDLNADIKPWLDIDVANTDQDATLSLMRDSVEQAVINFVENDFDIHVVTGEMLDSNGSDTIIPLNEPLISVEGLYLYVESDGSGGTMIETDDYNVVTSVNGSVITMRRLFNPRGRGIVRLDYTYGYSTVPPDVKEAILLSVEAKYRRKNRKSIGLSSRRKKDEAEGYSGSGSDAWNSKVGLPTEVVAMLETYRKFEFPVQPIATRNP